MPSPPHYHQHRARLRQRFRAAGAEGLHDYELLELLLTYGIPRRDVKPIAKAMIARFGSLGGVLDATAEDLAQIEGVGPNAAALVRLAKELLGAYLEERTVQRRTLEAARDVVDFARVKLSGLGHEALLAFYLSARNEVLAHAIVHEGSADHAVVYPRRLVEQALANKAAGLILVHNHPGGDTAPSPEDIRLTQTLAQAIVGLDLELCDHIIVTADSYFSFAENQLLRGTPWKT